jgi:CheY-like chemotaxis protein
MVGATVLIVDDDAQVRRALSACLKAESFRPLEASDGREALEILEGIVPDLVLCDLRMPGVDGLELLSEMSRRWPGLPLVVVSGQGTMHDAVEALKRGAWDYVTKPVLDSALLAQSLRRTLEKAELARQNREYRAHLEDLNQRLQVALDELRADHEAGRNLQFQLLPPDGMQLGNYVFRRGLWPSHYLSGDFVDYFALGDGWAGFYVADVSGHGAASAFVSAMLVTLIGKYREAYARGDGDLVLRPGDLLGALHGDLRRIEIDKHVAMFYGAIDLERQLLRHASAGQYPVPQLGVGEELRNLEVPGAPPLRLFQEARYGTRELEFPRGARLWVVSDGVLELWPQEPPEQRKARVQRAMRQARSIEALSRELGLERDPVLSDDITLLHIERRTPGG